MQIRTLTDEEQNLIFNSLMESIITDQEYLIGHSSFPDVKDVRTRLNKKIRAKDVVREGCLCIINT
jgi:hypothetical protein